MNQGQYNFFYFFLNRALRAKPNSLFAFNYHWGLQGPFYLSGSAAEFQGLSSTLHPTLNQGGGGEVLNTLIVTSMTFNTSWVLKNQNLEKRLFVVSYVILWNIKTLVHFCILGSSSGPSITSLILHIGSFRKMYNKQREQIATLMAFLLSSWVPRFLNVKIDLIAKKPWRKKMLKKR